MSKMDTYSSLLEAFEALNERKREDPTGLSDCDKARWKEMRRELEKVVFQRAADPRADTREYVRVPVSLAVRYWSASELRDRYVSVIGEGGLFVSTVDPLPVGSRINLDIVVTQQSISMPLTGEVVWVNQGDDPARRGMGIQFLNLSYEQKRLLYNLVDDNLRQRVLERRRFARLASRFQVQFVFGDGFFEPVAEDIGLGGMFIASETLIPIGERIRLLVRLGEADPVIKLIAEVARWVEHPAPGQPKGFGVRFLEVPDAAFQTIRTFLEARLGKCRPAEDTADQSGANRRQYQRLECRVQLCFEVGGALNQSYSENISAGGIFIQTLDPPAIGTEIQVTLLNPVGNKELCLPGTVVRVVEPNPNDPTNLPGIGVSFEKLKEAENESLRAFLVDYAIFDEAEKSARAPKN